MSIVAGVVPRWTDELAAHFPPLLPVPTRQLLLRASLMGISRAVQHVRDRYVAVRLAVGGAHRFSAERHHLCLHPNSVAALEPNASDVPDSRPSATPSKLVVRALPVAVE